MRIVSLLASEDVGFLLASSSSPKGPLARPCAGRLNTPAFFGWIRERLALPQCHAAARECGLNGPCLLLALEDRKSG